MEILMTQALVLCLICGPAGISLACWLMSATAAARSRKAAVVRVSIGGRVSRRATRHGASSSDPGA
jgi:hypothetical protein